MPCLPGGLGTVKWIHIIRPCRSQSHSRGPTCHLRKDEASARTVQMGLYGWGMCPQGIAPSASIGGLRTTIRLQNDGSDCPQPRPSKNAAPSWRIGDGQLDSKYQTLSSPIAAILHSAVVIKSRKSAGVNPRRTDGARSIRFHRRVEDDHKAAK
jgi:hypothetical protein